MEMHYVQSESELAEVHEKAYQLQQETARLELKIDYWRKRCADLEKEIERLQGIQIETTCDQCGANFMQRKKGRTARFCSAACRQEHYRTNKEFAKVLQKNVYSEPMSQNILSLGGGCDI